MSSTDGSALHKRNCQLRTGLADERYVADIAAGGSGAGSARFVVAFGRPVRSSLLRKTPSPPIANFLQRRDHDGAHYFYLGLSSALECGTPMVGVSA
jgi:hypothetical protein